MEREDHIREYEHTMGFSPAARRAREDGEPGYYAPPLELDPPRPAPKPRPRSSGPATGTMLGPRPRYGDAQTDSGPYPWPVPECYGRR